MRGIIGGTHGFLSFKSLRVKVLGMAGSPKIKSPVLFSCVIFRVRYAGIANMRAKDVCDGIQPKNIEARA